ncbi:MAG: hypothetical protein M3R02_18910, partial [Chloroflexota bacterium]|nr:hypothetical protein [Chloroflexota bacterium]
MVRTADTTDVVVLKDLIQESKDGEWGKSEPFDDSPASAVIRGTDFGDVRIGSISDLPMRYWSCPSLVDTKQLGDVLRKAPPPLVDCGRQIPEGRMSTVRVV